MICVADLTKSYGGRAVVDGVSFDCAPGTITGLLGPNGAGKSTTLKMLLNLVAPTRGSATIGGVRYRDLTHPARTVGVSLDASGLHPGRSVLETVRIAAKTIGVSAVRADQVLELVDIGAERKKAVRNCSLGMKQRLSLGLALLGEPEYLILDEPVNGLDPGGISWIRQLLRQTAAVGHTVLLSSHLLREVDAVADNLVIMNRGRVAVQGSMGQLLAGEAGVLISATNQAALRHALEAAGIAHHKHGVDVYAEATPERVGQLVIDHKVVVTKLVGAVSDRVESLYFDSTSDEPGTARRKAS